MSAPTWKLGDRATITDRGAPLRIVTITRLGRRRRASDGTEWQINGDRWARYGRFSLNDGLRPVEPGDERAIEVARLRRERIVADGLRHARRDLAAHWRARAADAVAEAEKLEAVARDIDVQIERLDAAIQGEP